MFRRYFNGRYGPDDLGFVLMFLGFAFLFSRRTWFIGLAILGYALFRMLSRRTDKRYAELAFFNRAVSAARDAAFSFFRSARRGYSSLRGRYESWRSRMKQRKTAVFVKCPKCRNTLRLPRHKGTLSVTCPVCGTSFQKKT